MKGGFRVWLNVCFFWAFWFSHSCGASTMFLCRRCPAAGSDYAAASAGSAPSVWACEAQIIPMLTEVITPVPAQLRKVRVVAPYLAGVAWPRTPLAFFGNPQTFPNPMAPGRYEWLVPVTDIKNEHYWTLAWIHAARKLRFRVAYMSRPTTSR